MELFPAVPLAEWRDTKETLHRFAQIVGKIRLASSVRRNHWWNVPFHLTGRGLTSRPMGQVDGNPVFTIDFDFVDHRLVVAMLDGRTVSFPLFGQSVASFHDELLATLAALDVRVEIDVPRPYRLPDATRPFAKDTEHAAYDPVQANRYWRVLSQVALVLEEFSAGFSGKASPVHQFWHSLDLAYTRFSGREADQAPHIDPVTREAYSRELISFGFWLGDDTLGEPAFYAYAAPEPAALAAEPLVPASARWVALGGSHLAVLPYDGARAQSDPRAAVLAFYEGFYQAAAAHADWDVAGFACPGGITDPQLRAPGA
ncbi:DUF5996 family protein [Streptomyces sp. NBC_01351]|uniref:DUF5996 family protein n=1 Tax=Streptomyces sp. NBC_01351 TaxID=2903833 RepID=UPI002E3158E9|nr:DUF5996 family protein [Streptomyces sp. NBC_01351]